MTINDLVTGIEINDCNGNTVITAIDEPVDDILMACVYDWNHDIFVLTKNNEKYNYSYDRGKENVNDWDDLIIESSEFIFVDGKVYDDETFCDKYEMTNFYYDFEDTTQYTIPLEQFFGLDPKERYRKMILKNLKAYTERIANNLDKMTLDNLSNLSYGINELPLYMWYNIDDKHSTNF